MLRRTFIFISVLAALANVRLRAEVSGIDAIQVDTSMTVIEIARANDIPEAKLLKGLKLDITASAMRLSQAGRSEAQAVSVIRKFKVLQATEKSKDWRLILFKFALWIVSLTAATVLLAKRKVSFRLRLPWMIAAAVLFGFILGSDPNPMGTVKDAIVLFGREGVIFPPRMVALAAFLAFVLLSNKSICGWGCHFGALQDAVNYLPTNKIRPPFWLTNGIRFAVLLSVVVIIGVRGFDWIGLIDPFKIFSLKWTVIGLWGGMFVSFILVLALFVYRPWCQFFCPFGLVGWMVEQVSLLKPRINREGCIKCMACVRSCPTQAMSGIYNGRKLHADCFACGNCIRACPAKVITWNKRKSNKTGEEK